MVVLKYSEFTDQLNLLALLATLVVLIWYAYDTHRIAKGTVEQTELITMPIMCLYIRNVRSIKDKMEEMTVRDKYSLSEELNGSIKPSEYYIALRNMGNGAAFNVEVECQNFKIEKYGANFFAPQPKNDEHAIKVVKKPSNKIRDLNELRDEVFVIKCQSILGKTYQYNYKIKDIKEHRVEFIKHD